MSKKKRSIGYVKKLGADKYLIRLSCGFDEFGKRIQPSKVIQCTSDTEAEKAMIEFYNQREKLRMEYTSGVPKTLKELHNEWMENHIKRNCAISTETFYSDLWRGYLADKGNAKLETLTPRSIFKLLDQVKHDRTKNALYKMLKAMFNKAIKWGYMTVNPCDRIDTPQYHAPEKQALTPEQISHVMQLIGEEETKYQAIFYFAAMCGMRRQEILGLKWDDIDFSQDCFYIRRAAVEVRGQGTTTKEPKTKKSARKLFLPAQLKTVLLSYMNEQERDRQILGDKWHDENWVFTQWDGKIMHLHTPTSWWSEFSARLDISGVTFHGLRHTAASYMIKNHVPITTISGVLGHANTTTTLNIYSHMIEDTKKEAINSLEKVFTAENEAAVI